MTHILNVFDIDIPAIVLVLLLVLGGFVMWAAQRRKDFDFAEMLQDTNGKASSSRLAVFVCLAVSSWAVIKVTMTSTDPKEEFNFFVAYVAIWSGAKTVEKLLDVLLARYGGNK